VAVSHCCGFIVQEAEAIDVGVMGGVDYFCDALEVDVIIRLYECDTLDTNGEDVHQSLVKIVPSDYFIVDLDVWMVRTLSISYLDDDGALGRRDRMVVGIRWLRNLRVEALWFFLDYYQHENDEQHQENVNQGRDIHLGRGRATACR